MEALPRALAPALLAGLVLVLASSGCGEGGRGRDADPLAELDAGDAGSDGDREDVDLDGGADGDPDADDERDADPEVEADGSVGAVSCADPPPAGAELPDPLPSYGGGVCPVLAAGRNVLPSSGHDRQLILVLPAGFDGSERLPLIFMWHWLGGDAEGFLEQGEIQAAADALRFAAVIPEARGDLMFRWPFLDPPLVTNARRDEELRFFDDMLACVAEQVNVNEHCVSSAGVSAGGLWTSHLAQQRSRHLSSFLSLSGGTGPAGFGFIPVRRWEGAEHAVPALVLWGGPTDFCVVDFATTSGNLEAGLVAGGHYLVECVHNCSHAQPPFDPPPGVSAFEGMWRFALDHPFWLPAGASPYRTTRLPTTLPEWCGQGAGGAAIRTGECEGGVLGECT